MAPVKERGLHRARAQVVTRPLLQADCALMPPSIAEVHAALTAPGQMFEMEEVEIRGIPTRTWKLAPPLVARGARAEPRQRRPHLPRVRRRVAHLRGALRRGRHARSPTRRRLRCAQGRPCRDRDAQLPRLVDRVLGGGCCRRGRRAAQRVVDGARARVRAERLGVGHRVRRRRATRAADGPLRIASEPPRHHRRQGRASCRTARAAIRGRAGRSRPGRAAARRSSSIPRTTRRSSTHRAPPGSPRARSAPIATSART